MSKRTKTAILNWTMLVSLVIVFASGMLLKPFPGMWLGISHAVSGIVLFVTVMIHVVKHRKHM